MFIRVNFVGIMPDNDTQERHAGAALAANYLGCVRVADSRLMPLLRRGFIEIILQY